MSPGSECLENVPGQEPPMVRLHVVREPLTGLWYVMKNQEADS